MASTITTIHTDNLGQIFQGLRNPSHEARLQAAVDLRRYVGLRRRAISPPG